MRRHLFSIIVLLLVNLVTMPPAMAQLVSANGGVPSRSDTNTRLAPASHNASIKPLPPASAAVAQQPNGKVLRVGLLIPLTGRNADIGRAMQDSATMALYDKYASLSLQEGTILLELLPKDTGDTPEQAAAAATQAIEQGAQFLIGPIFADASQAVMDIARAKNVSVLSLSNNLTNGGKGVYAYGFSPQEQAARVVTFALKSGKSRIGVLAPNSPLGLSVIAAAKEALAANGQTLVAEAMYAPQGLGIEVAVNQLIPPGSTPDFNALLLVEAGPTLNTLLRTLATRGATLPNVQLLGLGMWDDAALIRRTSLDGAWLASSPPSETSMFENHFLRTYNYPPPRIASLSYDAVSLAVTLATSGRPFDEETLANDTGFIGPANGIFRMRSNGKTERGLAVLQIEGVNFRTLSPAPKAFGGK
jgi:ABC-type branched-subunit amino acid transport system substrate-binding protein